MLSNHKIETSVAIVVIVVIGLVCVSIYINGEVERKRVLRDLEAGYMSGLSAEELSTMDSYNANASSGGGSGSTGSDADVSDNDQHAEPSHISHQLSTIPEERLSQLSEPEPSHVREANPD
ncbi:hypothetical protein LTR70_007796 [Exophiala xenobiotica]|uniref:Uncharacterized protein n=1 Tax=Lithohypha guttulata TaxID=1690604 RepID=A0ABR0JZX2_9EURO|nr:hypothetical protein LTR24_008618 [Lithohypha guttulata]KAK5313104.1 hypothetical protein LTR70_007796 [Exophiala xenobiotica]